jgi:hypothetical protein
MLLPPLPLLQLTLTLLPVLLLLLRLPPALYCICMGLPSLTRLTPVALLLLPLSLPLALYCVRAGLKDGQDVLELGCGWGSLTLFVGRAFPRSRVTAVSNSATQKVCKQQGTGGPDGGWAGWWWGGSRGRGAGAVAI